MTLAQLLAEIQTDPTGKGYAALVASGSDGAIADLLNTVAGGQTLFQRVDSDQVVGAMDPTEVDALSNAARNRLSIYLSPPKIDFRLANVRSAFQTAFSAGSTRTALIALASRASSRAEILWGEGATISHLDVAHALRGA